MKYFPWVGGVLVVAAIALYLLLQSNGTVLPLFEFPTSPTSTTNTTSGTGGKVSTSPYDGTVSYPKAGDAYCIGDLINIIWSSSNNIKSMQLYVSDASHKWLITNIAGKSSIIGLPAYSFQWNQHANQAQLLTDSYHITVTATKKDGSSYSIKSGTFTIKSCIK